jgi:hypothetical protein
MADDQPHLLANPDENPKERVDRELGELLQGLRVAATGVQVLFAFLLTLPFSAGFGKVDMAGKWLFYVALVAAAIASICLIAPTTQHRIMFRSGLKEIVLRRANELALAGGIAIAVSMTCSTALAVEVFLGAWPAALLAGGIALLSGWLWFVLPLVTLHRHRGHPTAQQRLPYVRQHDR